MAAQSGDPEIAATAGLLHISVDQISLTQSQDAWSRTVRDSVFVSAYPLASWLASSWWRLGHEPLPHQQPGHDWRMAHELGAANHGYVWPRVVFIPDGEAVQVWAAPAASPEQSVQYVQGLDAPRAIPLKAFQQSVHRFIDSVLSRLSAREVADSGLSQLWRFVQDDLADPGACSRRKLEAELGFDPEECPPDVLTAALRWKSEVGDVALSELAPAMSSSGHSPDLTTLSQLAQADGIFGTPSVTSNDVDHLTQGAPWERAVHDARALRRAIGQVTGPMPSHVLHDLLGLSTVSLLDRPFAAGRSPVAVAMPVGPSGLKFVARRRNAVGQRFELARFLGEHLRPSDGGPRWLASTDLSTSRQKYQRAFAAELLCPLDSLLSFLDGDVSTYAIEEASAQFEVSEQVVTNLLLNHGVIQPHWTQHLPYRMAS